MIPKSEIIAHSKSTGLSMHIIEKDYVLGWLLAGIFNHPALQEKWVFKGGTCLKKCYFETYRFSEDLDFTLLDEAQIDVEYLTTIFREIADWVYDKSAISIPHEYIEFEIYKNKFGKISCEAKISYSGPLALTTAIRQWPRIKLDLTAYEKLVTQPVHRTILHPYSDILKAKGQVLAYSYQEIFAEKIRALGERTRPRDLYDVITLFRQADKFSGDHRAILDILEKKCAFKNIESITLDSLEKHHVACKTSWVEQLAHQVIVLPPFTSFWDELPEFFTWLYSK